MCTIINANCPFFKDDISLVILSKTCFNTFDLSWTADLNSIFYDRNQKDKELLPVMVEIYYEKEFLLNNSCLISKLVHILFHIPCALSLFWVTRWKRSDLHFIRALFGLRWCLRLWGVQLSCPGFLGKTDLSWEGYLIWDLSSKPVESW